MSYYRDVLIQTYYGSNTTSSDGIRARPYPGQGLDVLMNVECSSRMRKSNPVGTVFLLQAKVTSREGGTPFLYAHHNAQYRVVSTEEIQKFMARFNA